jgi:glycosyltransferase involved in cell wall biosynthesis
MHAPVLTDHTLRTLQSPHEGYELARPSVLAVCHEFPPQVTPLANRMQEILGRLAASWDITVIAPQGSSPLPHTRHLAIPVPKTGQARQWLQRARLQKLGDWLPLSGPLDGWRKAAYAAALDQIGRHRPDLLLVFIYPYASGDVGLKLRQATRIPTVFNFDDSPSCDDMHPVYPSRWHFERILAWEDRIVEAAAAVIYVSHRNLEKVRARQAPQHRSKLHLIRCGVTDQLPTPATRDRRPEDPWTILYAGNMSGWVEFFDPPGRTPAYKKALAAWNRLGQHTRMRHDLKGSTPYYLVQAIRRVGQQAPALKDRFRFELIGNTYPQPIIERALRHANLTEVVSVRGALPHKEALSRVQSADVLFMCLPGRPNGSPGGRISAKTYEYLATDRPILAALPAGENREYLQGQPGVWITEPHDVEAMTNALQEISHGLKYSKGLRFSRAAHFPELGYDVLIKKINQILRGALPSCGDHLPDR